MTTTELKSLERRARTGDRPALAELVRHFRGELTQQAYAKLIRLSPRTLQAVEQGRGIAHPGVLILAMHYVQANNNESN